MKNIVLVLIVLFAIIGMASAAGRQPFVAIYSPVSGATYETDTPIELDTMYRGSGNEQIYTRVLVDGEPYYYEALIFEDAGTHTITYEVDDNPEYSSPLSKSVTITVV